MEKLRAHIEKMPIDRSAADWRTNLPKFPDIEFSDGQQWFWDLQTTEGPITIRFMPDVAPAHVANFAYLTELGFFDGLSFHRVITEFMAQGGCPLGSGTGGPGYKFDGECSPNVQHDRPGLLSMANTGAPCSDGSQFFLTFLATPWLDMKHTVFGEVTEGMDTVKALEEHGSRSGTPSKPLAIDTAKIRVE